VSAVFDGEIPLTKRFKINIFKSSTDYDLNVNPTRLRLNSEKTVSPDTITASVSKRELGSNQSTAIEIFPTSQEWSAENLELKYAYTKNTNV
jgi:hypothetical protein